MSFQLKGWDYTESVTNLARPRRAAGALHAVHDDSLGLPRGPTKILMIGLGGGLDRDLSRPRHAGVTIDTVELDPGVITAAKIFRPARDNRNEIRAGDGRVLLDRSKEQYDLILVDAYRGGYVPFHLLTKEFYALLKQRLAPGGAAASFNVHHGNKL